MKLRMALIGGGPGSFIGNIHYKAAQLDGNIELVAGVFSRDMEKNLRQAELFGIRKERAYKNYAELLNSENKLPETEKAHFLSITTPNASHYPIAKAALEAGFHVMCEKPVTMSSSQALELEILLKKRNLIFGLMHNYSGYPMIKCARDLIRKDYLGSIHKIVVRYLQGWLSDSCEKEGKKQAIWRMKPEETGIVGTMGDVGCHAAHLLEYLSGLKIDEVLAELSSYGKDRVLDTDGTCLLRLENGAKALLYASQSSTGEQNNLTINIYGSKLSLEWSQEEANSLRIKSNHQPEEIWTRGTDYVAELSPAASWASRLPSGHPEGFIEAFANHYLGFSNTIRAKLENKEPNELELDFPGIHEGVREMKWIEALVRSHKNNASWEKLDK